MSLSVKQVKFVNEYAQGKTIKEIRDVVGFLHKDNIRKVIKERIRAQSIKSILERKK